MAQITTISTGNGYEAHAAGCADLKKKSYRQFSDGAWTAEFETQTAMHLDHCADFLLLANGPEMALEDVARETRVMPCAAKVLPAGELPTYAEYYGADAAEVIANLKKYDDREISPERAGNVAPVELSEFERMVAASKAANARVFGPESA